MGHTHSHSHSHTGISTRKLVWVMLFNIGITLAEFIGGLLTGYLSLMADAVHNLSDVAALGLAWLGAKGAARPATKKSTYGYQRVEVMTAFISAVSLVVIAVFILVEAYDRYLNPQPITSPGIFLTVAVIGLVGNILSMKFLVSERDKSLNMKAVFLHMAYDALSSVAVIGGGIVIILTGWVTLDSILAAVIAVMIFWSSYLVIKEAVMIFMEAVPAGISFDEVVSRIMDIEAVRDVHDLHIWSLSSKDVALSCHVNLDDADFRSGPEIVARIENSLQTDFGIGHCTIQIDRQSCSRTELLCRPGELNENEED